MFRTLKTTVASALIGLGTVAALPAAAQAEDGIVIGFDDDGARLGIYVQDGSSRYGEEIRRRERERERRYEDDDRERYGRRCSPERALDKAERLGLRRARIVDVDRRTIEVSGRRHGDRVSVTFARERGCPVIDWDR